jgi:hypothetical protein
MFPMLRRRGFKWNHKRVHRICCDLKLNMRSLLVLLDFQSR